jgi:hypothetical protein
LTAIDGSICVLGSIGLGWGARYPEVPAWPSRITTGLPDAYAAEAPVLMVVEATTAVPMAITKAFTGGM